MKGLKTVHATPAISTGGGALMRLLHPCDQDRSTGHFQEEGRVIACHGLFGANLFLGVGGCNVGMEWESSCRMSNDAGEP